MDRLKLKILGLETNGCAVKFGLGNCYTKDYLTIYFKFDTTLYSLIDDNRFCLEPFFDGKIPFLLLVPKQHENDYFDDKRDVLIKEAKKPNSPIISVYYGDTRADVLDKLYQAKAIDYVDNGDVLNP